MPRQPSEALFTAADYAVFGVMLLLSLLVGLYYAFKDRKSEGGVDGYLLGGRNMNFFAVATSLCLTIVSAVTILGIPAEIYLYGTMYYWVLGCLLFVIPIGTEIYVPLFYRLKITSSFEYLQLRFNYPIRLLATAAYIIQNIMYIGVMIYAPAVALEAVTGFNIWAAIFSIGLICTIYTTLGGLKAVVWTDVLQGFIVLIGLLMTTFTAAASAGGWGQVWEKCWQGNRIDFLRFDFDPRYRHTVWSLVVGLGLMWTGIFATSQSQVQRYLCCRTEKEARMGMALSMIATFILVTLSFLSACAMYAYFYDCDPLRNGEVKRPDQLLPYLVMIIFRGYYGLPGLFVAGVFASCLSTVSSGINSMACVTVQDFLRPFVKWQETTLTWWSKGFVFIYGILCIGFACLSTILGNVLQTALSALSIVAGPLLGLFTLGVLFPCGDCYGGGVALICGIAFSSWLYAGSQQYRQPFTSPYYRLKPSNISGCIPRNVTQNIEDFTSSYDTTTAAYFTEYSVPEMLNAATLSPAVSSDWPAITEFYSLSYAYLAAVGFAVSITLGLAVSLVTSRIWKTTETDPKLIIPIFDHKIFCCLPKSVRRFLWCGIDRSETDETIAQREEKKLDVNHAGARRENGQGNVAYIDTEKQASRV